MIKTFLTGVIGSSLLLLIALMTQASGVRAQACVGAGQCCDTLYDEYKCSISGNYCNNPGSNCLGGQGACQWSGYGCDGGETLGCGIPAAGRCEARCQPGGTAYPGTCYWYTAPTAPPGASPTPPIVGGGCNDPCNGDGDCASGTCDPGSRICYCGGGPHHYCSPATYAVPYNGYSWTSSSAITFNVVARNNNDWNAHVTLHLEKWDGSVRRSADCGSSSNPNKTCVFNTNDLAPYAPNELIRSWIEIEDFGGPITNACPAFFQVLAVPTPTPTIAPSCLISSVSISYPGSDVQIYPAASPVSVNIPDGTVKGYFSNNQVTISGEVSVGSGSVITAATVAGQTASVIGNRFSRSTYGASSLGSTNVPVSVQVSNGFTSYTCSTTANFVLTGTMQGKVLIRDQGDVVGQATDPAYCFDTDAIQNGISGLTVNGGVSNTNTELYGSFSTIVNDQPKNLSVSGYGSSYSCICPSGCNRSVSMAQIGKALYYYLDEAKSAWWQTAFGDVLATTDVVGKIPFTCAEDGICKEYLSLADTTKQAGVFVNGSTGTTTSGDAGSNSFLRYDGVLASAPSWSAASDYTPPVQEKENYDYFAALVNLDTSSAVTIIGSSSLSFPSGLAANTTHIMYRIGSLSINDQWDLNSFNNKQLIVFVTGDLTINNTILNLPNNDKGFLAFIVKGNININPNLGTDAPSSALDVTTLPADLEGVYIADGTISTGVGTKTLVGEGMFIGWGGLNLDRDYSSVANNTSPAMIFRYRPDLLLNTPKILKNYSYTWKETAPQILPTSGPIPTNTPTPPLTATPLPTNTPTPIPATSPLVSCGITNTFTVNWSLSQGPYTLKICNKTTDPSCLSTENILLAPNPYHHTLSGAELSNNYSYQVTNGSVTTNWSNPISFSECNSNL